MTIDLENPDSTDFDPITWKRDPHHVGGVAPEIRSYGQEPLGAHQSDDNPIPPYWDSNGIENVDSAVSGLLRAACAWLALLFGFAVMFVGFGGLELIQWLRDL